MTKQIKVVLLGAGNRVNVYAKTALAHPDRMQVFDLCAGDDMIGARGGHGGGDRNLVLDFLNYLNGDEPSASCATLADSLRSHRVVYAADRARKNGTVEQL